ncbi:MAG: hypothetical protein ACMUIE_00850 [Thermoplasmatota archaeon]
MEISQVYRNDRSIRKLLVWLLLPAVPLFLYLAYMSYFEPAGFYALAPIPYIILWMIFFIFILASVYEVMVVYKDRIEFINPYRSRTVVLRDVMMIYYNVHKGVSFHMKNGKEYNPDFRFEVDNHQLEGQMQVLSRFIGFSEEHIRDSNTYCLVSS